MGTPILQRAPHWNFWHRSFHCPSRSCGVYTHLSHGRRSSRNSEDFEDITRCPRTLRPAKPALSWLQNESRKWFFLCQVERRQNFSWSQRVNVARPLARLCDSAFVGCRSGPGRVSCQVSDHPAWDRGGISRTTFCQGCIGIGID